MTITVQDVHLVLELAYFASGPALVVIAGIGLRQLKIAKDTAALSAKREAYKLAAEQVTFFHGHITQLCNTADQAIKTQKVTFLQKAVVHIDGSTLRIDYRNAKGDHNQMLKVAKEIVAMYNALDSFATYFTSRVADEGVAFTAAGRAYCENVRDYLPDLILASDGGVGHYRNIIKLFMKWNARIEAEKLVQQKESIEKKLDKLDQKPLRPLGT
jgi:hypothetical protein